MKRFLPAVFASLLLLAACGDSGNSSYESADKYSSPSPPPPAPVMSDSYSRSESGSAETDFNDLPQRAGLFLAYTHTRTIEAPTDDLKAVLDAHTQACMNAGPKKCLVTNSSVNGLGTEYASGYLGLKASPDWAEPFLEGLPSELEPLKSNVTESSTSAEDLTSQIIDTDAQLKALKTLRTRLQTLLETREGNLEELLGVERELARVQGQVDSYESNLANLRQRVSMSNVNLYYRAKVTPISKSVWRPLGEAFGGFFGNIALALATIVTVMAFLLPYLLIVGGIVWVVVYFVRRTNKKKTPTVPASASVKPSEPPPSEAG